MGKRRKQSNRQISRQNKTKTKIKAGNISQSPESNQANEMERQKRVVKKLCEDIIKEINIGETPENPNSKLKLSAICGNKELAKILIDNYEADINHVFYTDTDNSRSTCLISALSYGQQEFIKFILNEYKEKVNVNLLVDDSTILIESLKVGSIEIAREVLKAGADINLRNSRGLTPLSTMILINNLEEIDFLINSGADIKSINIDENIQYIEYHISHESDMTKRTSLTCLGRIIASYIDCEDEQPSLDVLTKLEPQTDTSIIILISYLGYYHLLEQIIKKNNDKISEILDHRNEMGDSILIAAIKGANEINRDNNYNVKILELLLENGADLGSLGNKIRNLDVLSYAVAHDHNVVERLVKIDGVNLEGQNLTFGTSPLMIASFYNNLNSVELLIQQGIDVNYQDYNGQTAIFFTKNNLILTTLINSGADINHRDNEGNTPIIHFLEDGNCEIVKTLIRNGVDLGIEYDDGSTFIENAIHLGHFQKIASEITNQKKEFIIGDEDINFVIKEAISRNDYLGIDKYSLIKKIIEKRLTEEKDQDFKYLNISKLNTKRGIKLEIQYNYKEQEGTKIIEIQSQQKLESVVNKINISVNDILHTDSSLIRHQQDDILIRKNKLESDRDDFLEKIGNFEIAEKNNLEERLQSFGSDNELCKNGYDLINSDKELGLKKLYKEFHNICNKINKISLEDNIESNDSLRNYIADIIIFICHQEIDKLQNNLSNLREDENSNKLMRIEENRVFFIKKFFDLQSSIISKSSKIKQPAFKSSQGETIICDIGKAISTIEKCNDNELKALAQYYKDNFQDNNFINSLAKAFDNCQNKIQTFKKIFFILENLPEELCLTAKDILSEKLQSRFDHIFDINEITENLVFLDLLTDNDLSIDDIDSYIKTKKDNLVADVSQEEDQKSSSIDKIVRNLLDEEKYILILDPSLHGRAASNYSPPSFKDLIERNLITNVDVLKSKLNMDLDITQDEVNKVVNILIESEKLLCSRNKGSHNVAFLVAAILPNCKSELSDDNKMQFIKTINSVVTAIRGKPDNSIVSTSYQKVKEQHHQIGS